ERIQAIIGYENGRGKLHRTDSYDSGLRKRVRETPPNGFIRLWDAKTGEGEYCEPLFILLRRDRPAAKLLTTFSYTNVNHARSFFQSTSIFLPYNADMFSPVNTSSLVPFAKTVPSFNNSVCVKTGSTSSI